jgi:hypothetical protein
MWLNFKLRISPTGIIGGDVLEPALRERPQPDGGPVRVDDAVGDRHVPERSAGGVGRQRDPVVAAAEVAIGDRHVFAAIDVESVLPLVEDADAAEPDVRASGEMDAPRGAVGEREIGDGDVFALGESDEHRALFGVAALGPGPLAESRADPLAVDGGASGQADVPGSVGVDEAAIHRLGIVGAEAGIDGVVGNVAAAEDDGVGGDFERHVALELNRADEEAAARREQDRAAALLVASIDGLLNGFGIERVAVAASTEVKHVDRAMVAHDALRWWDTTGR